MLLLLEIVEEIPRKPPHLTVDRVEAMTVGKQKRSANRRRQF